MFGDKSFKPQKNKNIGAFDVFIKLSGGVRAILIEFTKGYKATALTSLENCFIKGTFIGCGVEEICLTGMDIGNNKNTVNWWYVLVLKKEGNRWVMTKDNLFNEGLSDVDREEANKELDRIREKFNMGGYNKDILKYIEENKEENDNKKKKLMEREKNNNKYIANLRGKLYQKQIQSLHQIFSVKKKVIKFKSP